MITNKNIWPLIKTEVNSLTLLASISILSGCANLTEPLSELPEESSASSAAELTQEIPGTTEILTEIKQDTPSPTEMGRRAEINGNLAEAARWYLEAATNGDVEAQIALGNLYLDGKGVRKNEQEALKWYHRAADQNNPSAHIHIAEIYMNGHGVEQSPTKAEHYFSLAVAQGSSYAKRKLGMLYLKHQTTQNHEQGIRLLSDAAKAGEIEAAYQLGDIYRLGLGDSIKPNYKQALDWYKIAAEQGDAKSEYTIGVLLFSGSPELEKNQQEAVEWYRLAAVKGLADAQNSLGIAYAEGKGVTENLPAAVKWYYAAARQDHTIAQVNLATMLRYGLGVQPDLVSAYKWYLIANKRVSTTDIGMQVAIETSMQALAATMTPGNIQEATTQAANWLDTH